MADVKFTGLSAASGIPDNDSIMAISTYDGVSTYTSEKYTMSQLKDIVYVMEAEDKILFDSSGTNKQAIKDSVGSQALGFGSDGWIWMSADGTDSLTKGFCYIDDVEFFAGFNNGAGGTFYGTETFASISFNGTEGVKQDTNGLGFFGATPVAKPAAAVSAAGIHAALVSLGLIS